MNIFKKAKENKIRTGDYFCHTYKVLWQSKKVNWNHIGISYGIRRSNKWQIFPIMNTSNNCVRSIQFGVWKFYFEARYARAGYGDYLYKYPFANKLIKFYLLFF